MESQSHLLTPAELKKRGITRYDAEIIISNGLPLPEPPDPGKSQIGSPGSVLSDSKYLRSSSLSISRNDFEKKNSHLNIRKEISSKSSSLGKSNSSSRRRSPRKKYCSQNKMKHSPEVIKVKQEPLEVDDDIANKKLVLDALTIKDKFLDCSTPIRKKLKLESSSDPTADDGYEYTDAELRSHNLSDFLDNSPSLKKHKDRLGNELINHCRLRDQRTDSSDSSLPPLIPIETPSSSLKQRDHFSPVGSLIKAPSTPVRQSPRLHGQQKSYPGSKKFLGEKHERAVHLAKELNSLVAKASTFAQRLTDLVMESSLNDGNQTYQDPPVLEPEAPIISPSVSRRSSDDSADNIFSNLVDPSAPDLHLSHRRSKSVDEDQFDSVSKPFCLLNHSRNGEDLFSKSDGFRYRRRNSTDEYGKPPLLMKKDNFDNGKEILTRMDLHPELLSSHILNHCNAKEDTFLKTSSAKDQSIKRVQGKSGRQPKIIFRMKRDPELKKQIRAENAHCPNSNLQFKWDDDSDGDPGFSPPHRGATICPAKDISTVGNSTGNRNIFEKMKHGTLHASSSDSMLSTSLSSNESSARRKVRKVRLKMIDTSIHFDLISPSASPPKT